MHRVTQSSYMHKVGVMLQPPVWQWGHMPPSWFYSLDLICACMCAWLPWTV